MSLFLCQGVTHCEKLRLRSLRQQGEAEGVAKYVAELRRLAKTCNFGTYLNTALRYQLVCGLRDHRIQRELLCMRGLELTTTLDKERAMEAVTKEAHNFCECQDKGVIVVEVLTTWLPDAATRISDVINATGSDTLQVSVRMTQP